MGRWLKYLAILLLTLWFGVQVYRNGRALHLLHQREQRLQQEIAVLKAKKALLEYRLSRVAHRKASRED